jgi:uncharacterized protein YndB with AHSA1/START domain
VTDTYTLRMERTFQAPAQAVFDAFTSPEVMRRWWHVEHDWSTAVAEVDLRLGGAVRVVMRAPDGTDYGGGGVYTEIEPPHRLAFTWLWDGNDTRQLIEIDFEETAAGATLVRFTHSGLWDEEAVRSHDEGWSASFDLLDAALADLTR